MNSFGEFLAAHGVDDNIKASSEMVWFTNKNGKKFAYPIEDLESCLQALWIAGDEVKKLLNNDWEYEESKFRQAFGEALKNERANTVASNLGSQTPNTVRCLELYAYFKLNKMPTHELEEPDILKSENPQRLILRGRSWE